MPTPPPRVYTKVNKDICIACGLCQLAAPDLFEYDQEALAYVKKDANQGAIPLEAHELPQFKIAYQKCPTGAILRSNQPFPIDKQKKG